jgi:hypothetical protein
MAALYFRKQAVFCKAYAIIPNGFRHRRRQFKILQPRDKTVVGFCPSIIWLLDFRKGQICFHCEALPGCKRYGCHFRGAILVTVDICKGPFNIRQENTVAKCTRTAFQRTGGSLPFSLSRRNKQTNAVIFIFRKCSGRQAATVASKYPGLPVQTQALWLLSRTPLVAVIINAGNHIKQGFIKGFYFKDKLNILRNTRFIFPGTADVEISVLQNGQRILHSPAFRCITKRFIVI